MQFAEVGRSLALTNLDFLVVSNTAVLPRDRGLGDWAYVDLNQSLAHQDYLVW